MENRREIDLIGARAAWLVEEISVEFPKAGTPDFTFLTFFIIDSNC